VELINVILKNLEYGIMVYILMDLLSSS